MHYLKYNLMTGEIVTTGFCSDADVVNQPIDFGVEGMLCGPVTQGASWKENYVDLATLTLKNRPFFPIQDTHLVVGEHMVFCLPEGVHVSIDNMDWIVLKDGVLELEATTPASYSVRFKKWPYRDAEVKVVVNEA